MKECVDDLLRVSSEISLGGSESARQKHISRNKLLVRDRIQALIDPGSDFLETSLFAGYKVYDETVNAAGLVTGIGKIEKLFILILVFGV